MTASFHGLVLFAVVVVFMTALAVVLVLLHVGAVTGRLRFAFNLFGLGVVIVATMGGVGLIVGWLMTGRLELLLLSAPALVFAGAIFNLLTRRHMPWYEALGAGGGWARWKGLWNELRDARGSDAVPDPPGARGRDPGAPGAAPDRAP